MASNTFGRDYLEKKIAERTGGDLHGLNRNRFLLDVWAAGGMKRYKKLQDQGAG